jgi:AmiR/NasT family two-component response regulator
MSVLVACERDAYGELAVRELQRLRWIVSWVWPHPQQFPTDVGLIVTDYGDQLGDRLPWMPGEATSALLVLLPAHDAYDRKQVVSSTPDAVLGRPVSAHLFVTTVHVALGQFQYIRRLRSRITKLDENLKASRDIERAKVILMSLRGLDESQAYAFIRNQAMQRRTTVSAIATAIIDSHEVLG